MIANAIAIPTKKYINLDSLQVPQQQHDDSYDNYIPFEFGGTADYYNPIFGKDYYGEKVYCEVFLKTGGSELYVKEIACPTYNIRYVIGMYYGLLPFCSRLLKLWFVL